jgi:DNA-directed RNA polymerase subunit E'/Rpb7
MTVFYLLACFFSLIIFCPVYAEWFDGEVQKVDLQARTITISEIDPITDTEDKEEMLVEDATVFSGVKSLQDIRVNDNVTIEAQYDEPADVWKAVSVEVAEAGS